MSQRGAILIVDDNVNIFHSLQVNFRDFGFACFWAKNEAETLAHSRHWRKRLRQGTGRQRPALIKSR